MLASIGSKSVYEGNALSFSISATDGDSDTLTYSASNLPSGASFSSQTFSWTPSSGQAGTYSTVTFTVSDGSATDSETITITVSSISSPSAPTLSTPVHGQAGVALLPTFSWSAAENAQSYKLYVGTSENNVVAEVSDITTTSYTLTSELSYGTRYFWVVTTVNTSGTSASSTYGFITLESGSSQTLTSPSFPRYSGMGSFSMIASPLYPENSSIAAVLGDDFGSYNSSKWRLFHYDPASGENKEYPDIPDMAPGIGYWLISKNGGTIDITGTPVNTRSSFSISLSPGGNQIGNPFTFEVDFSKVKVSNGSTEVLLSDSANSWVDNALWGYESGYHLESSLTVGGGYLMNNSSSSTVNLIIPNIAIMNINSSIMRSSLESLEADYSDNFEWRFTISAAHGTSTDSDNYFGVIKNAVAFQDNNSLIEPPKMLSEHIRLYFINKDGDNDSLQYAADYHLSASSDKEFSFIVEAGDANSEVVLSWSDLKSNSQSEKLFMEDITNGKIIDMNRENEYKFSPLNKAKRKFIVRVGNQSESKLLSVNSSIEKGVYKIGDDLRWDIEVNGSGKVDAYAVIMPPSGSFLSLIDSEGNNAGLNIAKPLAANWDAKASSFKALSFRLDGNEEKGRYKLLFFFVKPSLDPLDTNNWLVSDTTVFRIE